MHYSPESHDYYWVDCSAREADEIAGYLFEAESIAAPCFGETSQEASRLADLVNIWTDFREWIESGGNTSQNYAKDL